MCVCVCVQHEKMSYKEWLSYYLWGVHVWWGDVSLCSRRRPLKRGIRGWKHSVCAENAYFSCAGVFSLRPLKVYAPFMPCSLSPSPSQVSARTESSVRRRSQPMPRTFSKRRSRFSSLWGLDTTSKRKTKGHPSIDQVCITTQKKKGFWVTLHAWNIYLCLNRVLLCVIAGVCWWGGAREKALAEDVRRLRQWKICKSSTVFFFSERLHLGSFLY